VIFQGLLTSARAVSWHGWLKPWPATTRAYARAAEVNPS